MNRKRVHILGIAIFIVGVLLIMGSSVISAVGDKSIISSLGDMGEFEEISSSLLIDATRSMLVHGEIPMEILELVGAGDYAGLANAFLGAMVESALSELEPIKRFFIMVWAYAPTIRIIGFFSSAVGGIIWFITGGKVKKTQVIE